MKLVSIPNNDSSTQVKDEEIYAAMNAMCEIFGETNADESVVLQSQIEEPNVLPSSYYSLHSNGNDTVKPMPNAEDSKDSSELPNKLAKRKKPKSLVSRADLDKYLKEKRSKRKNQKLDQRKRKKLTDPTQCLHCGKTFSYAYMESHLRTHSG